MPRAVASHDRQGSDDDSAQALVLALILGASERARIRGALRAQHRIRYFERIADLLRYTAESRDSIAAIIVEMRDADGRSTRIAVSQLRSAEPPIPMLAYCRVGAEHSSEIRALVLAGVHELIFE